LHSGASRRRFHELANLALSRSICKELPPARTNSKFAEQQQNHQNDDDQAQASAAIIPGAIEGSATYTAKAAEQSYYKNNQYDCPNRHFSLRVFVVSFHIFEFHTPIFN
jgi:hypothetical protein